MNRVGAIVLLMTGWCVGDEVSLPELHRDEQRVLKDREAIRQLECIVETSWTFKDVTRVTRSHVWMDGDKVREDRYFPENSIEGFREIRCLTPEEFLYWKSDTVPEVIGMAVHRWSGEKLQELKAGPPLRFPIDPRKLGIAFLNTTAITINEDARAIWSPVSTVLGRENERVALLDDGLVSLSYETMHGDTVQNTYKKAFDGQPTRLEFTNHEGYASWVESTYQNVQGIWFPERVIYQGLEDGLLRERDESVVQVISLNTPISNDIFTLAGMKIPPKNIQSYPSDREPVHWDGSEVREGYRRGVLVASPKVQESRSVLFWVNIAGLGFLAAWFLYKGLSKQSVEG